VLIFARNMAIAEKNAAKFQILRVQLYFTILPFVSFRSSKYMLPSINQVIFGNL